ncbi:DUF7146 domain-containing protein [Mesorhizobium sp. L-8-3]|uniref:DUF7146 domain-containing protein n=1 Tax=Mesorhizobium sp. L-8-3 TaxID=2744522 RepID=UPI001927C365|nr:toprim domain-containing protein [Mesorhizobium sp. L-8-3]BCH23554.1 hypothetical protein MesoLjLb_33390 [Mesorhizobium sp. L-8-3]
MNARSVAKALGGDVVGPARVLAPGPGHSRADRSMAVLLDPNARDGFVVSSFAGDDWRLCRDHVREMLGLDQRDRYGSTHAIPRSTRLEPVDDRSVQGHTPIALRLWHQTLPIGRSPAERYLRSRGLDLRRIPFDEQSLRFHPNCPFRLADGSVVRLPALVAAMVDVQSGAFRGVHRTALAPGGNGKADIPGLGKPKKMLGPASGACVKLSPDEDVTTGLHIAEGIETALACLAMGFAPVWAALSSGGIAEFPVLGGVEALTIFADHDVNGAGLNAARRCAARWTDTRREVTIASPPEPGRDWADR